MDEWDDDDDIFTIKKPKEKLKDYVEYNGQKVEYTFENFCDPENSPLFHMLYEKRQKDGYILLQDMMGIPEATLEGLYDKAVNLYKNGQYRSALQPLFFCCSANLTNCKYMKAMAAILQKMKYYDKSIEAYNYCASLEPDDPTFFYHQSDCYRNLNDPFNCICALEMAYRRCGDKPEYKTLKERISIFLADEKNKVVKEHKK